MERVEMWNRRLTVACCLVAAALLVPGTAAAAGFSNVAQSGTSVGLGGVGAANPDEPASNFFNPAAMGFQEKWRVYAGPSLLAPTADYVSPDGEYSTSVEPQYFAPPNFDATVPINDEFAAGVSITFPWGLGIEWPSGWRGRETFRAQSLETVNVNPNVAWEVVDDELSVSAGIQLMRSALTQERTAILRDDTEAEIMLGGVGHGIGAAASAQYRPTDDLTVGLNYRSAARISYSGRAHYGEEVEGTPFEQRMVDQDISTNVTLPHKFQAGVGMNWTDELWTGLDFNYITWSTYDEVVVEWSEQSPEGEPGETEPPLVQEANWENAYAVRLGSAYDFTDRLTGRAGLGLDFTPVPDSTVGPSLPDNDRYIASTGLGITESPFRFDVGYQFIYLPERTVDNGSVDGDYSMHTHVLGLNVGYGF